MKAKNYPVIQSSLPIAMDTTQMSNVLDVSMVDLWAAEAYFVMDTPVALKAAIETTIPKDIHKRAGNSPNCLKANMLSSITPASPQRPTVVQETLWKMGKRQQ